MSSLAAARADNFYYPQGFDPKKHNTLNQHNKQQGIVRDKSTIRFEMMFNVRCQGCLQAIGKGVRFNAQKQKVGQYLSTNIYEFAMKCHLCSFPFKIRTDPDSCDYILHEGLQKIRPNAHQLEQKNEKLQDSAFQQVERTKADQKLGLQEAPRLQSLLEKQSQYKYDFDANKEARLAFKKGKESKKAQLSQKEAVELSKGQILQKRLNLQREVMLSRKLIQQESIFAPKKRDLK